MLSLRCSAILARSLAESERSSIMKFFSSMVMEIFSVPFADSTEIADTSSSEAVISWIDADCSSVAAAISCALIIEFTYSYAISNQPPPSLIPTAVHPPVFQIQGQP